MPPSDSPNHVLCLLACLQEIIAINQDELGVPGDLIWQQGTRRVSNSFC